MAQSLAQMMKPTLELRADKTFSMVMIVPMEGTWKKDGHHLSLSATKAGDISKRGHEIPCHSR